MVPNPITQLEDFEVHLEFNKKIQKCEIMCGESTRIYNKKIMKTDIISKFILILGMIILSSCSSGNSVISKLTTNSKSALEKPYVILISLDGFRWDYIERFNPPNLSQFINNGVKAEALIPSFPSKTYPNHYTIATGMYPDHHGIVGNSFYNYKKNLTYEIRNREMVEDGTYYGGSPIWVQADKANLVSASYFFVGTEASIQGIRPTYYYNYNGSVKNSARVQQTLNWLSLPAKKRPHLITLYFSDMDDVGHKYGPNNNEELKKALFDLDRDLGVLFEETKATELPINIIVVSDHGMAPISASNYIPIEDIKNDSLFLAINNGSIVNIHLKKNVQLDSVFQYLKQRENKFKVYKTENTPGFETPPKSKDWGAIQIIPDYGYYFSTIKGIQAKKNSPNKTFGVHGYDPIYKDMHGVFYANGPAFKKGVELASVKNIHVFPLICEILALEIPKNIDGELKQMEIVLEKNE